MQQTYCERTREIMGYKNRLEKALNIEVSNEGNEIFVNGSPEDEYIAIKVIEAIELGFSLDRALLLKDPKNIFQVISIKSLTKKKDLEAIRARIIGTQGQTLRIINNLSDCLISLKNNEIGIIGSAEEIEVAIQAITSIIQGSKQGHVYGRLEREKKNRRLGKKGIEER